MGIEKLMTETKNVRNIGLDLIRVTEVTALAAGRWIGSGDYSGAHQAITRAMRSALDALDMNGRIVIGEDKRLNDQDITLAYGEQVGSGYGPEVDVIVDPIDGTNFLLRGQPGAISIVAVAPRDSIWTPTPATYMNKLVVGRKAAKAIVPECLNAPAAWTLALVARVKRKAVRDLAVIVLDRPRNQDLIEEIRLAGARVILRTDADAEGALLAASGHTGIDMLMGIGGATQGVISACAVKAIGGGMLAQLAPQTPDERELLLQNGFDLDQILTCNDMVRSNRVFFAATAVTNTRLLRALHSYSQYAITHSLLIRAETGTRRYIRAEHYAHL